MGDSSVSIVPRISEYKNKENKIKKILEWLQKNDIIEKELSDCILSKSHGYKISSGAEFVVKEPEFLPFNLITNGLEIVTERRIFTNMEGGLESLICPVCEQDLAEEDWEFFERWHSGETDNITCPKCNISSDIHSFQFEPQWGFSELGFTFWNWPDFTDEFIAAFAEKLETEVDMVYAHV